MQFMQSFPQCCSFTHTNPWIVQAKHRDMLVTVIVFPLQSFPVPPVAIDSIQITKFPKCQESLSQGILFSLQLGNEQQRKSRCQGIMGFPRGQSAPAQWPVCIRGTHQRLCGCVYGRENNAGS